MVGDGSITKEMTDAAARWVTARDAGTMTEDDERDLAHWLSLDPRHADAFAQVEAFWATMGSSQVRAAVRARQRRVAAPLPGTRPARRRLALAFAACIALCVVGAGGDWLTWARSDAMTATGERRSVSLADGSTVNLNTASAIAVDFSRSARTVRLLKGEAIFTVAPDRDRPFTVVAGSGATTALGTRFLVRQDGEQTAVTVTEHSVRVVQTTSSDTRSTVSEGQSVRYGPAGITRAERVDAGTADAWIRGALVFNDRPLSDVVRELGRYHPGYITVLGSDLAARRVSGGFSIDDPMRAIDTLEQTLGIRSVRLTDRLVVLIA